MNKIKGDWSRSRLLHVKYHNGAYDFHSPAFNDSSFKCSTCGATLFHRHACVGKTERQYLWHSKLTSPAMGRTWQFAWWIAVCSPRDAATTRQWPGIVCPSLLRQPCSHVRRLLACAFAWLNASLYCPWCVRNLYVPRFIRRLPDDCGPTKCGNRLREACSPYKTCGVNAVCGRAGGCGDRVTVCQRIGCRSYTRRDQANVLYSQCCHRTVSVTTYTLWSSGGTSITSV